VLPGDDVILCQITSHTLRDKFSITIEDNDIINGSLNQSSNVRTNRIFTADNSIILYKIGLITKEKMDTIIEKIVEIVRDF